MDLTQSHSLASYNPGTASQPIQVASPNVGNTIPVNPGTSTQVCQAVAQPREILVKNQGACVCWITNSAQLAPFGHRLDVGESYKLFTAQGLYASVRRDSPTVLTVSTT